MVYRSAPPREGSAWRMTRAILIDRSSYEPKQKKGRSRAPGCDRHVAVGLSSPQLGVMARDPGGFARDRVANGRMIDPAPLSVSLQPRLALQVCDRQRGRAV